MPSTQTDNLFKLIKTLTKSEKRSFKLYVNRIQGEETAKFIQLFDVLDKQKDYDEEVIFQKVPSIKRTQLSNLKRHLYQQLLTSLRLINIKKNIDIEVREQIDYARVLYGKGLYMQSLKILDRIKTIADNAHLDILQLEIIEFEKLIESRHITRALTNRAEELSEQADTRGRIIHNTSQLSNLALKLYSLYIRIGHVRDEADSFMVREFFKSNMLHVDYDKLTFFEKTYYCQCYVWYYFILENFPMHYRYSQQWIDLFEEFPDMKVKQPDLYMRGLHNLLGGLFFTGYYSKFTETLSTFEAYLGKNQKRFSINNEVVAFLYLHTAKINQFFVEGRFSDGVKMVPSILRKLDKYEVYLDQHRVLTFYYKIACLYFGSGDNDNAVVYLSKIINLNVGNLREDIQCYARILHLIAHYELGHFYLLEYLVKSVYRFLAKMDDLNAVQQEILRFLRRELYSDPKSLNKAFKKLRNKLADLAEHPYERRSFLYLDILSWLESKIENRPVEEVIREKFLASGRRAKPGEGK